MSIEQSKKPSFGGDFDFNSEEVDYDPDDDIIVDDKDGTEELPPGDVVMDEGFQEEEEEDDATAKELKKRDEYVRSLPTAS